MTKRFLIVPLAALAATALSAAPAGATLTRDATGTNPAAIASTVDLFRNDLGGTNQGVGGSFDDGRREINWDGVPAAKASPNAFNADFFNSNSPRGVEFSTPGAGFLVSRSAVDGPVRFSDLEPQYATTFGTFSAQRLFTPVGSDVVDVRFLFPGTTKGAVVKGFGAVFTDVDGPGTELEFFDRGGKLLSTEAVPEQPGDGGLSFVSVTFNSAVVARVRITAGTAALGTGVVDGGATDVVALDDFIYGEPSDGDTIQAAADNCPRDPNQDLKDSDRDSLGDVCDPDDDNDGIPDAEDEFPLDPTRGAKPVTPPAGDGGAAPAPASGAGGDATPLPSATPSPLPPATLPALPAPTVDRIAPGLAGLKLSARKIAPGKGVKVSYTLTEAASVKFTVERRSKRKWRPLSGAMTRLSKPGKTTFTFKRKLATGTYRLVVVASDAAGNASGARRVGFAVKR